jgi:hypothetical protein
MKGNNLCLGDLNMFECPYYRDCLNKISKMNPYYEDEPYAEMSGSLRDYDPYNSYDFQSGAYFYPDSNSEMDEGDEIVFKKVKIESLKD